MRLETPEDVHQLLSFLANSLATEERPDTTRAQALNAVAASLLRAVHVRDLRKQVTQLTADLEQERRLHADLQRELAYAREDLERYRQTLAQMRERLARPTSVLYPGSESRPP
jgi:chromosome segregation ATPase